MSAPPMDADDSVGEEEMPLPFTVPTAPAQQPAMVIQQWTTIIAVAWATGSAIYLALTFASMWRVGRLVRRGRPATPPLQNRVENLARAMGLRRCPKVAFVDDLVPPMLCAVGTSPRILLPGCLWDRLDPHQQDTVLAHELAHLRRRDHWARSLELVVAVLYWWHPLVWWSRHELREAAEQCCDAWVVWSMPRLAGSYAAALVEAIEFISSAPAAVPALASTMGQFTDLKRRLVMIKQGNAMRSLTRPALAAVFGAAGFLLPFSPSLGQEAPEPRPAAPNAPVVVVTPPAAAAAVKAWAAPMVASPDVQVNFDYKSDASEDEVADPSKSDDSRGADRAQYEKARAEVQSLRAQLRAAERRLAALDRSRSRADRGDRAVRPPTPRAPEAPTQGYAPMPKGMAQRQSDEFARAGQDFARAGKDMAQRQSEEFARAADKIRAATDQLNAARDRGRQTLERRLDMMERQMSEMSNQLRQLRRQMSDQPNQEPQKR